MPAIHNEIDLLTVGGIRNDVRDTFTRAMISNEETQDVASKNYYAGEYLILKSDRNFYRTKVAINAGTQLTPGVNIEPRTLGQVMRMLELQSPLSLMNIVGNYEPTGKATKKYVAGDRVILQTGQVAPDGGILYTMYRVTTTINQGVTFTVGTNVVLESNSLNTIISNLNAAKMNAPTVLTKMLSAGGTSLSFTDNSIGSNSRIDVYTDRYGVNPLTMSQSGTTLTMTFKAQTVNVNVKIVVNN